MMEIRFDEELDPYQKFRRQRESGTPYETRIAELQLNLLDSLERGPVGPRLSVSTGIGNEMWISYSSPDGASASIVVDIDRPDYGPLVNGLPRFHYRIKSSIRHAGDDQWSPEKEERIRSVESAYEFIRRVIVETRDLC